MGRIGELAKLEARLRSLWLDYSEIEDHTDTNKRFAVQQSLEAIIDFMHTRPGWRGLDFAFVKMLVALANIEKGTPIDWLSNPPPSRPPIPIEVAGLRGRLAYGMQLRIDQGDDRQQAAEWVLRRIPSDSPAFDGTKRSWKTVARWRDACTGNAPQSIERESYEAMLALGEQCDLTKIFR